MNKVTLTFPDYESLWQFKEKVKSVNISIEPKKKNMHGPFASSEIEMAIAEFKAVNATGVVPLASSTQNNSTQRPASRLRFLLALFPMLRLQQLKALRFRL